MTKISFILEWRTKALTWKRVWILYILYLFIVKGGTLQSLFYLSDILIVEKPFCPWHHVLHNYISFTPVSLALLLWFKTADQWAMLSFVRGKLRSMLRIWYGFTLSRSIVSYTVVVSSVYWSRGICTLPLLQGVSRDKTPTDTCVKDGGWAMPWQPNSWRGCNNVL